MQRAVGGHKERWEGPFWAGLKEDERREAGKIKGKTKIKGKIESVSRACREPVVMAQLSVSDELNLRDERD